MGQCFYASSPTIKQRTNEAKNKKADLKAIEFEDYVYYMASLIQNDIDRYIERGVKAGKNRVMLRTIENKEGVKAAKMVIKRRLCVLPEGATFCNSRNNTGAFVLEAKW